jgi:hypothetical protein
MLDMRDGQVEQIGDVRVVERVDNLPALPLTDHEAELAQKAKLVRYGGMLHPDRSRKLAYRARRAAQPPENEHAARSRKGLHRVGNLARRAHIDVPATCAAANAVPHAPKLA